MEQVISEGADALNTYISSGEIEELKDVIPQPDAEETENNDDEEDDDELPDAKRPKVDRIVNHNAQIIYNNNDSQPTIPSLMAIDVKVDVPHGKDSAGNWATPAGFNKNAANQPPSLLNLNVAPPFDEIGTNSTGGGWHGQKRRNRDSEGNRISRFDREGGSRSRFNESNESSGSGGGGGRNRRSGNSTSGSSRQERSSGRSNRRI